MNHFRKFLAKIPYDSLLIMGLLLGLAPFFPEPHLVEKIKWLFTGHPFRPIDVFDLFFHSAPVILLFTKIILERPFSRPKKT